LEQPATSEHRGKTRTDPSDPKKSFNNPFTGKRSIFICAGWIRVFPPGVALTMPAISKEIPVPFFNLPFCLIWLPSELSRRSFERTVRLAKDVRVYCMTHARHVHVHHLDRGLDHDRRVGLRRLGCILFRYL
jgi:hypothetical protein